MTNSEGLQAERNPGDGSALSRRDFAKLTLGALGAAWPAAGSVAADKSPESEQETDVFVSPDGDDRNPGGKARPFENLERARDHIRSLMRSGKLPHQGITVWLRGGVYHRSEAFTLGPEDSGSSNAPIAYRAYRQEKASLIGGRRVSGFTPIRDAEILRRIEKTYHDKILQLDLKALGIANFGKLVPRIYSLPIQPAPLELFFDNRPMTLARWPNTGWAKVGPISGGGDDDWFPYEGDRPRRWRAEDDVWVHGYWNWDWADAYLKIRSIDPQKRQISTCPANGVRGMGFTAGHRYYALNILEELDEPGEWYLDRNNGQLYFWPPTPLNQSDAHVSLLEEPLIKLEKTSHITLQGLAFEFTRGSAVEVAGGSNNQIAACTFRNIGTLAMKFTGGVANGAHSNSISETGEGGIILSGGDRMTLTPAGNYAVNNHIFHYCRWTRTYRPAINLQGVGNHVAHNLIHDAPHTAILVAGNDHVIEFNEIHHVAQETSDVGAIYMGRDYTQRGHVIRYNYIHDLPEDTQVNGIYLDDCWSGTTVYGNVLYKMRRGVLVGGGRDNTVANNIFVECHPAVHVDARGLTWASFWFDGRNSTLLDRLKAVNYEHPPYSTQYPQLVSLWRDEPGLPKGNSIVRNVCYGGKWLDLKDGLSEKVIRVEGNYVGMDPKFVDASNNNFQLRDDSPAFQLGFKRIPIEKIGLLRNESA